MELDNYSNVKLNEPLDTLDLVLIKNCDEVLVSQSDIDLFHLRKSGLYMTVMFLGKHIPLNKSHSKKYKNPHRTKDKRKNTIVNKTIEEDMQFANEIETSCTMDEPTPIPERPKVEFGCFFDEVRGRFKSNSLTESEDSFEIVFTDNPTNMTSRSRKISDCDSEDSFIIFEDDSSNNCYSTQDVFRDSDFSESSDSDLDDSDNDNDNLVNCSVANLSRTISDLTDEGLYGDAVSTQELDEDEVDCGCVMDMQEIREKSKGNGVMMNRYKKMLKWSQPPKKVTFSEAPPKVHVLRVWAFAARQARPGHWQRVVLDRERFTRRIADVDMAISWVLKPQHRARIKFQRFMPWWHAQRRLEEAEKKALKEQEEEKLEKEHTTIVNGEHTNDGQISNDSEEIETHIDQTITKIEQLKIDDHFKILG